MLLCRLLGPAPPSEIDLTPVVPLTPKHSLSPSPRLTCGHGPIALMVKHLRWSRQGVSPPLLSNPLPARRWHHCQLLFLRHPNSSPSGTHPRLKTVSMLFLPSQ